MTTNRNAVAETEYTPSRSDIERAWGMRRFQHDEDAGRDVNALVYSAEFRRWYESERRKWQAEALRDAATDIEFTAADGSLIALADKHAGYYQGVLSEKQTRSIWLRTRAAELENGED